MRLICITILIYVSLIVNQNLFAQKFNRFNKNGEKVGKWFVQNEGSLNLYRYRNGLKNGFYYKFISSGSGNFYTKGRYKNDLKHGVWITYRNNNISSIYKYKKGIAIKSEIRNLVW
jgi:hypothetical protein